MIKSSKLDSQTDHQAATNNHQPSIPSATGPVVLTKESSKLKRGGSRAPAATTEIPHSALPTPHSELALLAKEDLSRRSVRAKADEVTTINSQPSTINLPDTRRKIRRNGRIASLPRLQRDMVNHMLWNAVPYKNIVA